MYYSLTFIPFDEEVGHRAQPPFNLTSDRNTWTHWKIVPTSRPVFAPPSPKTSYVDVPGANGKLDVSQILTGYPLYSNRTGSFEFIVLNDFRHWQEAYTDIMTTLHNKVLACVYEEDPEYYYVGRWNVQSWSSGSDHSRIVLGYDIEPYKWRIYDSNDAWLWDPFNFRTGVIASRADEGFNSSVIVDPENYPISDDPQSPRKYLLDTRYSEFMGDETTDDIGTGYLDAMNNISEVIGTAPICPEFTVKPRTGESTCSVRLYFNNPELAVGSQTKIIDVPYEIENRELTDIILTNYTGTNNVTVSVQGDGVVSWVYRPGRF